MGFETDSSSWPPAQALASEAARVAQQNAAAQEAFTVVCRLLLHRLASMSWRSEGWPGRLAWFASSDQADQEMAWDRLLSDFGLYK
eukprot:474373-Alexandrium_andersonii.AAC.1